MAKRKNDIIDRMKNDLDNYKLDTKNGNIELIKDIGIIKLDLRGETIYKPYSNKSLLSTDIYDFINESYDILKQLDKPIKLQIEFDEDMSIEEKNNIINLVRIHYAIATMETKNTIKRTRVLSEILLFVGALFLSLYILFEHFSFNYILCEIINIFGWVFIWEACHNMFLTNSSNRIELVKNIKLYDAICNNK